MRTDVTDYTQFRLGELMELAMDNRLIDFCYMAPEGIVVSIGGRPLTFDTPAARSFLSSLLQGWARSETQLQPATLAVELRERLTPPATPPAQPPLPSVDFGDGSGVALGNTTPWNIPEDASLASNEAYVDAVLSCAEKLNLIEGFSKDRTRHRVKLKTRATTADMSYFETLEYLTGSILDELRTLTNNKAD